MANYSNLTRAEQVLKRLREADGGWVDGPDLANEAIGGSEGLKRLRELRDGSYDNVAHDIRKRKHPDPARDIYQYRLVPRMSDVVLGNGDTLVASTTMVDDKIVSSEVDLVIRNVEPAETYQYKTPKAAVTGNMKLGKTEDGHYVAVYVGPVPDPELPVAEGQTDMGVDEAVQLKYTSMPTILELGRQLICPRCKGHRKFNKEKKVYADKSHDPHYPSKDCMRCDGFGVIPAP